MGRDVVLPSDTPVGRQFLSLGEKTTCNDTASCISDPVVVEVRVRWFPTS